MNNTSTYIFMFIGGMFVGAAAMWWYYEQKSQNVERQIEKDDSKKAEAKKSQDNIDISEYAKKLKNQSYTSIDYSAVTRALKENKNIYPKPYIISPEEFASEGEEYDTIELLYFADGVVAYEEDEKEVDDVDWLIGSDALNHFGEYEDDTVYIRNEELKCDYEVTRDLRRYADISKA